MAPVTISSLRKSYGKHEVIHGVDIDIADGEFVTLVGPSGCGKSTLLRMIAGLEDIGSGELRIGDRIVNDLPSKDRDIAMVFQSYALYPHMTVAENMGFSLKLKRASKTEIAERVTLAARTLGLENLLERRPKQLSGGQRQRVAMGRAIVRDPQVFLFDEPLSNLDAKLRVQMRAEIKELHRRLGTTTVYVTHDQVEAMTMADKIVVLRDGVIEQTGVPMDLYDKPANVFVAGFIGSPAMNFIEATVDLADGANVLLPDGTPISIGSSAGLENGRRVRIGIRPEHLAISDTGIPAKVTLVEPTGPETVLTTRVGDAVIVVLSRDRRRIGEGEVVRLLANPEFLHIFDCETGARLA